MSMTTNHIEPTEAYGLVGNVGQLVTVGYHKEMLHHNPEKGESVIPVTITDARWLTREEFEAGLKTNTNQACWFILNNGHRCYGMHRNTIFDGRNVDDRFEEVQASLADVSHIQIIHPPQAPSEE